MGLIEQAVFTSAETDRRAGYHLVAQSAGLTTDDAAALSAWGPSHDSLIEPGPEATSVNFHPLPSGAYCVSRTTAAGWEYSGRGGHRVYTQCLAVPPDVLARFGNNPFALLRAAMATGAIHVFDTVPQRLEPIMLAGRAPAVDQALLARLATQPGAEKVAALVHAALETECLAVVGEPNGTPLLAGLMSCLPVEVRPLFSFSTGLKYSSRRPVRVVAIPNEPATTRWMTHQTGVTVLDLTPAAPSPNLPLDGWARLVGRLLGAGRMTFLASELSKARADLTLADLPALGLQLLEDFETNALRSDHLAERAPAGEVEDPSGVIQQAHAAHAPRSEAAATAVRPAGPAHRLDPGSPAVVAKLEYLDDLVFEALSGQQRSLEELHTAWPAIQKELGDALLAESREQYLRYALQIWDGCVSNDGVRQASRAVEALDVLCILFNEE
jgi:hypothetical protein